MKSDYTIDQLRRTMKVVLAVDDSLASEQAVNDVAARSWPADTIVRLLHVVGKVVPPAASLWYDARGSLKTAHEQVVARNQTLVDGFAERVAKRGLGVEATVKEGNPAKLIVKEAIDWGADLIVLGWNRHSKIRQMLITDVAHYVLDHAPCSVEIVHRREKADD
jgi:nucleotide-binding universal stress UspA family protein